jgi:hypothetical protein
MAFALESVLNALSNGKPRRARYDQATMTALAERNVRFTIPEMDHGKFLKINRSRRRYAVLITEGKHSFPSLICSSFNLI